MISVFFWEGEFSVTALRSLSDVFGQDFVHAGDALLGEVGGVLEEGFGFGHHFPGFGEFVIFVEANSQVVM